MEENVSTSSKKEKLFKTARVVRSYSEIKIKKSCLPTEKTIFTQAFVENFFCSFFFTKN
jgi:hypothetical protein